VADLGQERVRGRASSDPFEVRGELYRAWPVPAEEEWRRSHSVFVTIATCFTDQVLTVLPIAVGQRLPWHSSYEVIRGSVLHHR
jgi:hypothetical protein